MAHVRIFSDLDELDVTLDASERDFAPSPETNEFDCLPYHQSIKTPGDPSNGRAITVLDLACLASGGVGIKTPSVGEQSRICVWTNN